MVRELIIVLQVTTVCYRQKSGRILISHRCLLDSQRSLAPSHHDFPLALSRVAWNGKGLGGAECTPQLYCEKTHLQSSVRKSDAKSLLCICSIHVRSKEVSLVADGQLDWLGHGPHVSNRQSRLCEQDSCATVRMSELTKI